MDALASFLLFVSFDLTQEAAFSLLHGTVFASFFYRCVPITNTLNLSEIVLYILVCISLGVGAGDLTLGRWKPHLSVSIAHGGGGGGAGIKRN